MASAFRCRGLLANGQKFSNDNERYHDKVHNPKGRDRDCCETPTDVARLKVFRPVRQILTTSKEVLHAVVEEEHRPKRSEDGDGGQRRLNA